MSQILPQVEHFVVVMLENRSFDNLCGWFYSDGASPQHFVPALGAAPFDGLNPGLWNPSNASFFQGSPPEKVFVVKGASSTIVPDPDPQEEFDHITFQLYGPQGASPSPEFPMQGFVVDYESAGGSEPAQIMQAYSPGQIPVLSALATNFAISDRWFCSTPNQTWPNRSFVHAGTSNGNVNNGEIPDPFEWNVPTIFNVLETLQRTWTVYCDTVLTPSLTRTMFPKLWDPLLDGHFRGFGAFKSACASGTLPTYSFIEPSFMFDPNDAHPPHDMVAAEAFLFDIWEAVSLSPAWNQTLLIITFDEHGGCYDHVLPLTNAATPDQASDPGQEGFLFNRFGVRVPTIFISPFIEAGTVVRASASDSDVPFDHTSILATLRDWLAIPPGLMLPSERIAKAPNLGQVLNRQAARLDRPAIPKPPAGHALVIPSMDEPLNDLQKSLISGSARRYGMDPLGVLGSVRTRGDAVAFFARRPSIVDAQP